MGSNLSLSEFCFKYKCSHICCNRPVVLEEEKVRITKYLGLSSFATRRLFKKRGKYYVIDKSPCPFLKEGKCSIEPIKPINCRIYPLVIMIKNNKPSWHISDDCPAAEHLDEEFIKNAKKAGRVLLDLHKSHGLLF
ncbi:MAG: hypothetical protein DRP03_00060 [Candidatus Aenigmatarchaeota archaeon]|nr:MAG: hypothetical protein DRP03_00060 [Candidatus Aenigmarchaeota archaeon]